MILGTIRLLPSGEQRRQVLEILRSVQGPVLAQSGCSGFHIYEEQGEEAAVVLIESWESEAALTTHIRSEAYRRILGACELSTGSPDIHFDHVTASEGMALIERALAPEPLSTKGTRSRS